MRIQYFMNVDCNMPEKALTNTQGLDFAYKPACKIKQKKEFFKLLKLNCF